MKKILEFLLLFFLMTSCASSMKISVPAMQAENGPVAIEENETVRVSIEQDGKLIAPSNGIVTLDKAAFDVSFSFPKPMAVLVNASFDDQLINLASAGAPLAARSEFSETSTIVVTLFNPDMVLYVSDDASSPWFYEKEDLHNFNRIEIVNGHYKCTRSIDYVLDIATEETIGLEIIEVPIYLVFVPTSNDKELMDENKIQTKYLKIEWNK